MKAVVGQKFGRLTILRDMPSCMYPSGSTITYVRCVCACGQEKTVSRSAIVRGQTTSCGCYASETTSKRNEKHGMAKTPEHEAWCKMRARCNNPNDPRYYRYGARGIAVCKRWDDFRCFLRDMGTRPSHKHSLERIDNDNNYMPSNCRWATAIEQARNRSNNIMVEWNGETMPISELAQVTGMPYETLRLRISKYGWPVEKAVSIPRTRGSKHMYFLDNRT